ATSEEIGSVSQRLRIELAVNLQWQAARRNLCPLPTAFICPISILPSVVGRRIAASSPSIGDAARKLWIAHDFTKRHRPRRDLIAIPQSMRMPRLGAFHRFRSDHLIINVSGL